MRLTATAVISAEVEAAPMDAVSSADADNRCSTIFTFPSCTVLHRSFEKDVTVAIVQVLAAMDAPLMQNEARQ